jgi:hypothetical protein
MLTEADNPTRSHKDEAVPDAFDDLKATCQQLVNKLAKAGTPPIILLDAGTQVTCFTGTRVQILTLQAPVSEVHDLYVPPILEWLPSLLANAGWLVQKYKYRRSCWYKSTNTDATRSGSGGDDAGASERGRINRALCFHSAVDRAQRAHAGAQVTCFTGTPVQIPTHYASIQLSIELSVLTQVHTLLALLVHQYKF